MLSEDVNDPVVRHRCLQERKPALCLSRQLLDGSRLTFHF